MNICIVGWYFNKQIYDMLDSVSTRFNVTCIAHKDIPEDSKKPNITYYKRENVGLEFGAYDYYLKNCHTKGSVLFMHDDVFVEDQSVFDTIEKIESDHAWIWKSRKELEFNHGGHGRGVYVSEKMAEYLKAKTCKCEWCKKSFGSEHTGIFFDTGNNGFTGGKTIRGNAMRLDAGIQHFKNDMCSLKARSMATNRHIIIKGFSSARRGSFQNYL